jgi:3-(3-hydroxy-phenyl)propionate hydroxylase
MIGETAPWKPLWISIYSAKCLTLPNYRSGRVLFAGDAAHLVPIFGVRGLNSGLDDAANLAWKLALVHKGAAADSLLDSYSSERVRAARENIAFGAKSTEFMAPPHRGFSLMREAALRLALVEPAVRSLINPRQTSPIEYPDSPLNQPDQGCWPGGGARAGTPAPEAKLQTCEGAGHMTELFGGGFVALYFSAGARPFEQPPAAVPGAVSLRLVRVAPEGAAASHTVVDEFGQAWKRYDAMQGTLYLIRPDGYVMGRWRDAESLVPGIHSVLKRALEARRP